MKPTSAELDLYLSLEQKHHHALNRLTPGWVFQQPMGVTIHYSQHHQVFRRPDNWTLFISREDLFEDHADILTRRYHWLPDDPMAIAEYTGNLIRHHLEAEAELKINWDSNLEQSILTIGCGESSYQQISPTQREAALQILKNVSKVIRTIRVPSITQLQGDIELVNKGWDGKPSIIGTFNELESFKNKYLEYWVDSGHGSFSQCRGRMHLIEGEFYLMVKQLDYQQRLKGVVSHTKNRKVRRLKK